MSVTAHSLGGSNSFNDNSVDRELSIRARSKELGHENWFIRQYAASATAMTSTTTPAAFPVNIRPVELRNVLNGRFHSMWFPDHVYAQTSSAHIANKTGAQRFL